MRLARCLVWSRLAIATSRRAHRSDSTGTQTVFRQLTIVIFLTCELLRQYFVVAVLLKKSRCCKRREWCSRWLVIFHLSTYIIFEHLLLFFFFFFAVSCYHVRYHVLASLRIALCSDIYVRHVCSHLTSQCQWPQHICAVEYPCSERTIALNMSCSMGIHPSVLSIIKMTSGTSFLYTYIQRATSNQNGVQRLHKQKEKKENKANSWVATHIERDSAVIVVNMPKFQQTETRCQEGMSTLNLILSMGCI